MSKKDGHLKLPVILMIKAQLHAIRRVFFLLCLFVLLVVSYLTIIGFPKWCITEIENNLATKKIYLSADAIKLDLNRGFLTKDLRIYKTAEKTDQIVKTEKAVLSVDFIKLLNSKELSAKFDLTNSEFSKSILTDGITDKIGVPTIEQVDGSWNSGKLKLTKTDVVWGKLNINAVGDIIFDSAVKPIETPKSKPAATATNATEKAVTKKESGPSKYDVYIEKIENVVTDLNKTIKINEPVNVDLNFELNGPIKERSFVVAKIDTKNVSYKDFNASNADLYFTWSPNSLNLHSLRIDQNDR